MSLPVNNSVDESIREPKNKQLTFKAQLTSFDKYIETFVDSNNGRVKIRIRIESLRK